MPGNTSQPGTKTGTKTISNLPPPDVVLPQIASTVEQNVMPAMTEAQRIAAQNAFSGRKAVSRGTIFLAFYLWFLSGAAMISFIARYTDFFPGDMPITRALQNRRSPLVRRFMAGISEIGFPTIAVPLTVCIAGIF